MKNYYSLTAATVSAHKMELKLNLKSENFLQHIQRIFNEITEFIIYFYLWNHLIKHLSDNEFFLFNTHRLYACLFVSSKTGLWTNTTILININWNTKMRTIMINASVGGVWLK